MPKQKSKNSETSRRSMVVKILLERPSDPILPLLSQMDVIKCNNINFRYETKLQMYKQDKYQQGLSSS